MNSLLLFVFLTFRFKSLTVTVYQYLIFIPPSYSPISSLQSIHPPCTFHLTPFSLNPFLLLLSLLSLSGSYYHSFILFPFKFNPSFPPHFLAPSCGFPLCPSLHLFNFSRLHIRQIFRPICLFSISSISLLYPQPPFPSSSLHPSQFFSSSEPSVCPEWVTL